MLPALELPATSGSAVVELTTIAQVKAATSAVVPALRAEFDPEVVYLNTASLGLTPRRSLVALEEVLQSWRSGRASPPDYDAPVNASRARYAALVGVEPEQVAVGSQASVFAGLVAAALPDGSEVLTASGEFTSIVFGSWPRPAAACGCGRCPWSSCPRRSPPRRRWSRCRRCSPPTGAWSTATP